MFLVLGIDPGTRVTGWGVVARDARGVLVHRAHGTLEPDEDLSLERKLTFLRDGLGALIALWRPHAVAVEDLFVHRNARSALVLGHARAMALLTASDAGLEVHPYPPARVKQSVVGHGRAEKAQVQEMVKFLLKLPEVAGEDASDALAIALTHLQRTGGPAPRATAPPSARSRSRGGPALALRPSVREPYRPPARPAAPEPAATAQPPARPAGAPSVPEVPRR